MKRFTFIFLCWLLSAGCTRKKNIPANILTTAMMEDVLWDLMRADQYLSTFIFPADTSIDKKTASENLYQQVFTIHKISKKEFQKSFDYYSSHPLMLISIMDSLQKKPFTPELENKINSNDSAPPPVKKREFRKPGSQLPENNVKKVIPD
jgi:hypothetical protein